MSVTQITIIAYDDDNPICAVDLDAGSASIVITGIEHNGETVVKSAPQETTDDFEAACELMKRLTMDSAPMSCCGEIIQSGV